MLSTSVNGKPTSKTPISELNLLTILPDGVSSKKGIGDLIIDLSIFLCSVLLVTIQNIYIK